MGWFFRKSIKIFPGLRINLSKLGIGLSTGIKGVSYSVGPGRKPRIYAGLGPFRYQKSVGPSSSRKSEKTGQGHRGCGCLLIIIIGLIIIGYFFSKSIPPKPTIQQPAPIISTNIQVSSSSKLPSSASNIAPDISSIPSDLFSATAPSKTVPNSKALALDMFRSSHSEYVPSDLRANIVIIGYVKAHTNMYVPEPLYPSSNMFANSNSTYSLFGKFSNSYFIICTMPFGTNIISRVPFYDELGNKVAEDDNHFVTICRRVKLEKGIFPIDSRRYYPVTGTGANVANIIWYSPKSEIRRILSVSIKDFIFIGTNMYENMISRLESDMRQKLR